MIALDVTDEKLALATAVGAHDVVLSDADAARNVRELLGGKGAQLVLDFVGAQPTIDTAMAVADVESDVTIVGISSTPAAAQVGFFRQAYEASVTVPYWGSRSELIELVDLAHRGVFDVHTETFAMADAPTAYERLHAGTLTGRAVVVPSL